MLCLLCADESGGWQGIPLLVLANKNDLPGSASVETIIQQLKLGEIEGREVCCYSISAKNSTNIDITMEWLIKRQERDGSE